MTERISAEDAAARIDARHWTVREDALHATFATGSFMGGLSLVRAVAELAERAQHHPDVDLRYPSVHLRLTTHDAGGLTAKDVDLAAEISALADERGIEADQQPPPS